MAEFDVIRRINENPNDPNGLERRQSMLIRNRELAEHYASQETDLAVLLVDTTHEPELAQFLGRSQQRQEILAEGNIPTAIIGAKRWTIYKMLREYQRNLHRADARDPAESPIVERLKVPARRGHFYLLAVSGGKQLAELPIPPA
jgi:hypothetical protein